MVKNPGGTKVKSKDPVSAEETPSVIVSFYLISILYLNFHPLHQDKGRMYIDQSAPITFC